MENCFVEVDLKGQDYILNYSQVGYSVLYMLESVDFG
jgi:hypothetical protein